MKKFERRDAKQKKVMEQKFGKLIKGNVGSFAFQEIKWEKIIVINKTLFLCWLVQNLGISKEYY